MKVEYHQFRGLVLHYEPHEVYAMKQVMLFLLKTASTEEGKGVARYFLELVEKEGGTLQ